MASMRWLPVLMLNAGLLGAAVDHCACDAAKPETLKARECSLCAEAERQSAGGEFFVLHDTNPRKPNRWLVLPRAHGAGPHPLDEMAPAARLRLWRQVVATAKEKFGDDWGAAYNGAQVRTQCHLHVHVGRFIHAAETANFRLVRRLEDMPAPPGGGLWIHPVAGGFHVHTGEQTAETVLVR
jgi:diadenosine tetraphosphate (Ap4A) HIT family hydrolase